METELAKYGAYGIAIAIIGILFWVIKFLFKEGTGIIKNLNDSIKENTKVTNENLTYLKQKNGSMEKCFVDVTNKLETITNKLQNLDNDVKFNSKK